MIWKIIGIFAIVVVAALIAIVPYCIPFYSPSPIGTIVTNVEIKLAPRVLSDRLILSDRKIGDTELKTLQANDETLVGTSGESHDRLLEVYRFRWPFWRRIDLEYGGYGALFTKRSETIYGDSDRGDFTVGVRVEIFGKGHFKRNGLEQLVLHSHSVGGSGQYVDWYTIASLDKAGNLQRDISVSNFLGLSAQHWELLPNPTAFSIF